MPGSSFAPCSSSQRAHSSFPCSTARSSACWKSLRAERGHRLDDLEAAEIRGVAHRRPPVAAHSGMCSSCGSCRTSRTAASRSSARIATANACGNVSASMRCFSSVQCARAVLARDDELRVAQAKRARGDCRVVRVRELRMPAPDAVERVALAVTPAQREARALRASEHRDGVVRASPVIRWS